MISEPPASSRLRAVLQVPGNRKTPQTAPGLL
uniref:Uncharacterized protein n=1 Tax=Anguilla anguilla TaxID=7936 RepID=A0A0E9TA87_ANGAN